METVLNSRQPLDRLFALCDPVTLRFDLILIDGRGIVMDYPYANFGDFIFMRFGLSCGQADRQTDRQTDKQT